MISIGIQKWEAASMIHHKSIKVQLERKRKIIEIILKSGVITGKMKVVLIVLFLK